MTTFAIEPFFFDFERDFVTTLKCVPMIVRYKLDSCGIKLQLHEWAKFGLTDKETLAFMPCHTNAEIDNYGMHVSQLVKQYFGHEASTLSVLNDTWNNVTAIPHEINQKAAEWNCPAVSIKSWTGLNTLQRFALVKLSRSGHEGSNFPVAMKEFMIFDS